MKIGDLIKDTEYGDCRIYAITGRFVHMEVVNPKNVSIFHDGIWIKDTVRQPPGTPIISSKEALIYESKGNESNRR